MAAPGSFRRVSRWHRVISIPTTFVAVGVVGIVIYIHPISVSMGHSTDGSHTDLAVYHGIKLTHPAAVRLAAATTSNRTPQLLATSLYGCAAFVPESYVLRAMGLDASSATLARTKFLPGNQFAAWKVLQTGPGWINTHWHLGELQGEQVLEVFADKDGVLTVTFANVVHPDSGTINKAAALIHVMYTCILLRSMATKLAKSLEVGEESSDETRA